MHVSYSLQTLSDVLAWQDGYTENVIETFNWLIYNIQNRHEMNIRFSISDFRLCLNCKYSRMYFKDKAKKRCHCNYYMTWLKFADQIQNKGKTWYFKFQSSYYFQTLSYVSASQRVYRNDITLRPDLVFLVLQILLTSNFVIYTGWIVDRTDDFILKVCIKMFYFYWDVFGMKTW